MFERKVLAALVLSAGMGMSAEAQNATITLGQLDCLPLGANGVLNATVSPEVPGTSARLYFRRMNDTVEDFYFVEMESAGAGGYWAALPVPTDDKATKQALKNHQYEGKNIPNANHPWAEWWRAKEGSVARNPDGNLDDKLIQERASQGKQQSRAWMSSLDDASLQAWLDKQAVEPAEYYVALVDGSGRQVATSPMRSVAVTKDCRPTLTPQQQGFAKNLVVGETAVWQASDELFHWECNGVVTRRNTSNVLRADDKCRGCVVAWWPVAIPAGAVAIVGITDDNPTNISPSLP